MIEIGTPVTYRGRPHVVVGATPMGATPELLELEDTDSGRIRRVERTDPNLEIGSGKRPRTSQDPTDEQASR